MRVGVTSLRSILKTNAAEIRFVRRTPGPVPTRRMLCTLDFNLLGSIPGRVALNFRPARNPPPYNAMAKGLLFVWDIFMQDWRACSLDNCEVISTIKTTPANEFWNYFNKQLSKMSAQEKVRFHQM